MLFMVVERFREEDGKAVYDRLEEKGRMMPEGLEYRGSWVEPDGDRCFQLAECEDPDVLGRWAAGWDDLVEFEFIPVVPGSEMEDRMGGERDRDVSVESTLPGVGGVRGLRWGR